MNRRTTFDYIFTCIHIVTIYVKHIYIYIVRNIRFYVLRNLYKSYEKKPKNGLFIVPTKTHMTIHSREIV